MPDLRCPHGHKLTEQQVKRLWGQLTASKRTTWPTGGKRPNAGRPFKCRECQKSIRKGQPATEDGLRHADCAKTCELCGSRIWPHDKLVEGGNMHQDCTTSGTFD